MFLTGRRILSRFSDQEVFLGEQELLDNLLDVAFFSSEELSHAIKDSFETFINVRQNKPAELIAKFVDLQLRGGGRVPLISSSRLCWTGL